MKREGFWRYATPPVNLWGVPLPFTLIYLLVFPYPAKATLWGCTAVLVMFVLLDRFGWSLRALCTRLFCLLRGALAAGRPWWYRHVIETSRHHTGL